MIGPPWIRPGNSSEYCTPRLFYFPTIPSRTRTSALSSYCKCDVFRMQKKIDTRYCPVLQHRIPPLSETICFSSCFLKARLLNTQSTLIGQLTHAWLSVVKHNKAAVLNQFLCAKIAAAKRNVQCRPFILARQLMLRKDYQHQQAFIVSFMCDSYCVSTATEDFGPKLRASFLTSRVPEIFKWFQRPLTSPCNGNWLSIRDILQSQRR